MPTATVIALRVLAKRSSDHAFNVSGIVESLNQNVARLGANVNAFDFRGTLFSRLADPELDNAGHETGRLLHDSAKLRSILAPLAACVLSNESLGAALDQAIVRRQSQFLARLKYVNQLQGYFQAAYPQRLTNLEQLLRLVDLHFQALHDKYNPQSQAPAGVTTPKVVMATHIAGIGSKHEGTNEIADVAINNGNLSFTPKQWHSSSSWSSMTRFDPAAAPLNPPGGPPHWAGAPQVQGAWVEIKDSTPTVLAQQTVSVSENDELRHPNLENQMRHERISADLRQEILSESIFNVTVPELPTIWKNDLTTMDMEIRQLQIQFIESFLVPRLTGIVAAVNVEVGDNVRAGDAIIRIQDESVIFLAGQVKYRGPLRIGQNCTINIANVFSQNPPLPLALAGRIVALKGYDSETHRWSIVIEAQNAGPARLPVGYAVEPEAQITV